MLQYQSPPASLATQHCSQASHHVLTTTMIILVCCKHSNLLKSMNIQWKLVIPYDILSLVFEFPKRMWANQNVRRFNCGQGHLFQTLWDSFFLFHLLSLYPGISLSKDALHINRARPEMADTCLPNNTFLLPFFSAAALVCELLSDRVTQRGRKHKTAWNFTQNENPTWKYKQVFLTVFIWNVKNCFSKLWYNSKSF